MITFRHVGFALVSGLCYGLNDIISPCGVRLCRDLCESLSSCSFPVHQEETITCVLRNRSLGVDPGGVRECRTLASTGGVSVNMCFTAVTKMSVVQRPIKTKNNKKQKRIKPRNPQMCDKKTSNIDKSANMKGMNISGIKHGSPVVLSNNFFGIYLGARKVVYVDNENEVHDKQLNNNLTIRKVLTYRSGNITVYGIMRVGVCTLHASASGKKVESPLDFVSMCLTGKKCKEAYRLGFKFFP